MLFKLLKPLKIYVNSIRADRWEALIPLNHIVSSFFLLIKKRNIIETSGTNSAR